MTKTAMQLNGELTTTVLYVENADGTYSPASAAVPLPVSAVVTSVSGDVVSDAKGIATAAAPTYTEGAESALSLGLDGRLRVLDLTTGYSAYGPTAAGSAAANPPVLFGGTVDGAGNTVIRNATIKSASTAATATDTSLVVIPSPNSDLIVGSRDSVLVPTDATLTRPNNATPYTANQGMGTAATCQFKWTNFFRKVGNTGLLTGSRLVASVASIATTNMGTVRLYLYNTAASFDATLVDQGAWTSLYANVLISFGYIEFSAWNIGGSGSDMITAYGVPCLNNMGLKAAAAARDIYGYLITAGAFTPLNNSILLPQLSMAED